MKNANNLKQKMYYDEMLKRCIEKKCTTKSLYEKSIPCKKCYIRRESIKDWGVDLFETE